MGKALRHEGLVGWLAAAVAVCAAVVPAVAFGQEPAGGHAAAAEEPSLFGGSVWNAIWALAIFVLLLGVLGKFAWGPVVKMLEERERKVADHIAAAQRDRDEALVLLEQYRRKLAEAEAEAERLLAQGRSEAAELRDQIVSDARDQAEEARQRAVRQIELARNEAVASVFAEAASMATRAAGRIIGRELAAQDHSRLIEQTLDELAEHNRPGPGGPAATRE